MHVPIETEIKLAATPAMLDALAVHPALAGADVIHRLENTWFDTTTGDLHRAGAMLRIRDTGKGREQTLKLAPRSGLARIEWTAPVAGDRPEPAAFPPKARRQLARLSGNGRLEPIASARVERHERTVEWRAATVTVAFDRGEIVSGSAREPICELELELAGGPLHDALALARELPLGPELLWSARSKAARAFALARAGTPRFPARPPRLDRDMPAVVGFTKIAWGVIHQLLSAYPLVLADGSPEGVHQARVALRRLRSAIKLFAPLVRDEQMPVLRAALGTAARGLGRARDLFVLADAIDGTTAEDDSEAAAIAGHLTASLAAATADAQAVLSSAPFQRLLFELAIWVEAGPWREQARAGDNPDLRAFAARALGRSRRRLLRRGLDLGALDEQERHDVRKDAKQLRYAVGFLEALWREAGQDKTKNRFARDLARVQDSLGALNDLAIAATGQQTLFADADPITAARLGARLETMLGAHTGSRRKLLRRAEKALIRIADVAPWWKHH